MVIYDLAGKTPISSKAHHPLPFLKLNYRASHGVVCGELAVVAAILPCTCDLNPFLL